MKTALPGFSLDTERRELRINGNVVNPQPIVFDLIAYLAEHRERVVSKNELLESLWPDVFVTDASVQRAVSLARSLLRQNGWKGEIRTYSRRGYRLCAEGIDDATDLQAEESPPPGPRRPVRSVPAGLLQARSSFESGHWPAAAEAFASADREQALVAGDLELWGAALHRAGELDAAVSPLERAVAAASMSHDPACAARSATLLADIQFERRQVAIADGWLRRAARLVQGLEGTYEEGFYAWFASRFLLIQGELDEALRLGRRALEIGRAIDSPDLEALGLLYTGLALVALGETRDGTAHLDEAGVVVLGGSANTWSGGLVFCGIIWAAMDSGDWDRASQWADHFARWCERTGAATFPGLCQLHRADIHNVRGQLTEAEAATNQAIEVLQAFAPWAEGDARRVLGEIRYLKGDLPGAEEAFREAYELGWDPQPGYALLLADRGKMEAAVKALERSLHSTGFPCAQRRGILLAHMVIVALRAGDRPRAQAALQELETSPQLTEIPTIAAMAVRSRAEFDAIEGDIDSAIAGLRRCARLWSGMNFSMREAEVRLRLTELLYAEADYESAALELAVARALLQGTPRTRFAGRADELEQLLRVAH